MVTISEGNIRVSVDGKHAYINSTNTNGFLKLELSDFADLLNAVHVFDDAEKFEEALQSDSK